MTQNLISTALMKAVNLRQSKKGLVFHGDRGSQYTSQYFRKLLKIHYIRASMGGIGSCYDNAVVERFFGSLKHDWVLRAHQLTRAYMKYYNFDRFYTLNVDMSPINYEKSSNNVSCLG